MGIDHSDRAGWRSSRRNRLTGTEVSVYDARAAGIEDQDPDGRWASVCEVHSTLIVHRTRKLAEGHAADPCGWCGSCRAVVRGEPLCPHDNEPLDFHGDMWACPSCYDEWSTDVFPAPGGLTPHPENLTRVY